jgi:hypothetical protein
MLRWLFFWRPPCLLRVVIANFKDDQAPAIRGVLWSSRGHWLTLREPLMLKAEPTTSGDKLIEERLVGEVVIHRSNVAYLQVLP